MARSIQLSVSETDLPDLQKFYLQELEKAEKRVQELKQTLAKLGSGGLAIEKSSVAEENEELSAEATVAKGRRKKKAKGSQKKPRWSEFILQLLKAKNQLVRVGSIIDEAVREFDIDEEERKSTEQAIYNSLNRLRNVNKEVQAYTIPGRKGSYYGLINWFDEGGVAKEEYVQRL